MDGCAVCSQVPLQRRLHLELSLDRTAAELQAAVQTPAVTAELERCHAVLAELQYHRIHSPFWKVVAILHSSGSPYRWLSIFDGNTLYELGKATHGKIQGRPGVPEAIALVEKMRDGSLSPQSAFTEIQQVLQKHAQKNAILLQTFKAFHWDEGTGEFSPEKEELDGLHQALKELADGSQGLFVHCDAASALKHAEEFPRQSVLRHRRRALIAVRGEGLISIGVGGKVAFQTLTPLWEEPVDMMPARARWVC
jgi:hypothetical protein